MTDPPPIAKNPSRVPDASQVLNPVGTATGGGVGVQIVKSKIVGSSGTAIVQEGLTVMSDRNEFIADDGVYEDADHNRFQYKKGHVLSPGSLKLLKKVGGYPNLGNPGEAEHAETKADAAPQNKAESKPENKS